MYLTQLLAPYYFDTKVLENQLPMAEGVADELKTQTNPELNKVCLSNDVWSEVHPWWEQDRVIPHLHFLRNINTLTEAGWSSETGNGRLGIIDFLLILYGFSCLSGEGSQKDGGCIWKSCMSLSQVKLCSQVSCVVLYTSSWPSACHLCIFRGLKCTLPPLQSPTDLGQ